MTNVGSAITYADSAAQGATFTINTAGIYAIEYRDMSLGATQWGISKNSAQLTTDQYNILIATRAAVFETSSASGFRGAAQCCISLAAGDVIRAHGGGPLTSTSDDTYFTIRKVA